MPLESGAVVAVESNLSARSELRGQSVSVLSCGRCDKARKLATDSMILTFQVFVFIAAYLATGESLSEIDSYSSVTR